jgi:hypothetical protein
MKLSLVPVICAAIIAGSAMSAPAFAQEKSAKACADEWRANKAANQDKGITEKAYVAKCKGGAAAAAPAAAADTKKDAAAAAKAEKAAAAAKAKEEKAAAAAKAKEEKAAAAAKAKDEKAAAAAKPAAAADKKPAGKTAKACSDEWRADKKGFQTKGITEKSYVEDCRAGTTTAAAPAAPAAMKKETAAPAAAAPAAKEAAKEKKEMAAPGMGKPEGANQYTSETLAKAHCITGTVVWANLDSKIYHFAGNDDYGHTKQGAYMCEKDALAQSIRAAKNEKHP